jgi:hypothetical protein
VTPVTPDDAVASRYWEPESVVLFVGSTTVVVGDASSTKDVATPFDPGTGLAATQAQLATQDTAARRPTAGGVTVDHVPLLRPKTRDDEPVAPTAIQVLSL